MRFTHTTAVITGAGSGIGKAAAIRLAKEGAEVILVGRTLSKLEASADEINSLLNRKAASVFQADVTNEKSVQELALFVDSNFGDLHILINNAGGSAQSRILDTPETEWNEVQNVNLKSVFLVSKELGKIMAAGVKHEVLERKNRSIVNVASLSGHQAGAHIPHYSSAKAGVINFTKSLALEMAAFGIRVNSVSPGFVETPLTEDGLQNEKFAAAIARNTALGRVGKADEIANIIAFAASPEASYMTGTDILADGGWLIK
ncbi:3-oxoacyl-[acyl-carrier protein] reductase [Peribacillus deserti]|uniref:3-oxoacyl-[acyl-carrier protein] reductase n=1 Tax=Peribacillus deserti TaxID=673318 RepID=A0ABS2QDR7_9BACI|nr:SDR family oxidoreductase [Peribacillus deserti]MBM7691322.1 3-oxoacyl-[acyl-carrier protein] reductase [Peribacillus deserti]